MTPEGSKQSIPSEAINNAMMPTGFPLILHSYPCTLSVSITIANTIELCQGDFH